MFQFPAYICLSTFPKGNVATLGNSGFKSCMQIPQTYRSLPRPSSRSKPSYPSNSLNYVEWEILLASLSIRTPKVFLSTFLWYSVFNSKLPPKNFSEVHIRAFLKSFANFFTLVKYEVYYRVFKFIVFSCVGFYNFYLCNFNLFYKNFKYYFTINNN